MSTIEILQPRRSLNLHEHYSLGLLDEEGVPVPRGAVADSPQKVRSVIEGYGKETSVLCGFRSAIEIVRPD